MNLKELVELASTGNADAQYKLGKLYQSGDYVIQSNNAAIELFRKAAEQGHKGAEHKLNSLIKYIHKIPTDTNKTETPSTPPQRETDDEAYKLEVASWFADVSISLGISQKASIDLTVKEKPETIRPENNYDGVFSHSQNDNELIYKRDNPVIVDLVLEESKLTESSQTEDLTKHKRGDPLTLSKSDSSNANNEKYAAQADESAASIGIIIILAGMSIFGYQVYEYLRHDIWHPISLITALQFMNVKWAIYPTDWIGLYKVLDFIPLSIFLCVFGFSVATSK